VSTLRLKHDALKLFKDNKVLIRVIGLGVTLFFRDKKADFLKFFEFALDVSGVFFNKFGETTDVRLEVRVLGVHDNYLSPHS